MADIIQKEVIKFFSNANPGYLNMVNMMDTVGTKCYFALNAFKYLCTNSWIIDTDASNHMYGSLNLFDSMYELERTFSLILPNATTLKVTKAGHITISPNLILIDTLYIPDFCFSLISVHKLT